MTDQSADDRPDRPSPRKPDRLLPAYLGFRNAVEAIGKATRVRHASGLVGSFLKRMGVYLERRDPLNHVERKRVIDNLFHEGRRGRPFAARFSALMALSVAIAVLGVLSDSTAVVIGAMLVAPLMGPVLGVAAAMVMGWTVRVTRQVALVVLGAVVSIALAAFISFILPGSSRPLPAELVARTSPNLLDLGIALAAGAAGAYGQVRRQASDALPGVAVAVALIPPLAVVGVTLQLTEWQMALGSLLLFMVNVSGIIVSGAVTFIAAGFVPGRRLLGGNASIASGLRWASLAVIIVVLPLQFGRGSVLPPTDQTAAAVEAVEEYVDEKTASEVVNVSVHLAEGFTDVEVVVANAASAPPVSALARYLADQLQTPIELSLYVVETQTERASVTNP